MECEKCGKPMAERMGKNGAFMACTGYPECRNTKNVEKSAQTAFKGVDKASEASIQVVRKERPHSYEFGKAVSRHKIYYETTDELIKQMAELKLAGLLMPDEMEDPLQNDSRTGF